MSTNNGLKCLKKGPLKVVFCDKVRVRYIPSRKTLRKEYFKEKAEKILLLIDKLNPPRESSSERLERLKKDPVYCKKSNEIINLLSELKLIK